MRREAPSSLINDAIKAAKVRLVGENGEQIGICSAAEAQDYADQRDLDLVLVALEAEPPVCRVMDYGKFRYEEEQKARQARRRSAAATVKEVRLRPKIAANDYNWKRDRLVEFLGRGFKVRLVLIFRGREREHPERGRDLLLKLAADVAELGRAESMPLAEGRTMTLMIAPITARTGSLQEPS